MATLGATFVLGLPTVLTYKMMQRRLAVSGQIVDQSFAAMIQWVQQAISGIKETLVTGRASFFVDRYVYQSRRVAEGQRTFTFLPGIPRLAAVTFAFPALVAFVLFVLLRGQVLQAFLPILTMFAMGVVRLMPATSRISNGLAQLRFHYTATEVIYKELTEI